MSTTLQITVTLAFPLLISLLTTLPPLITAAAVNGNSSLTAYDLLESYGFPVGILPKGITGYDLDKTTGKFNAYLNGSCSFSLEGSYQLRYKSKISGYIAKNKLTNLSGVSVKVLFLWLNIVEVVKNGDNLEFSVGIASASFSVDNFLVCPQCGCGLDCNSNVKIQKIRSNHLVSSV
ncbi:uncharacterized protein At5g01610-like [Nicotiana tabacum]|uniref:Uncharacterized protein At5g01610-like n=1 Tax=Nicotiana tabacum TaxID=4097 RepID=A0A1S3ZR45_TOBAC|nr:PREDICTED: uncharacterized protein LOC107789513 [Nicotiana tabacum]